MAAMRFPLLIILVLALVLGYLSLFTVDEREKAIMFRLGEKIGKQASHRLLYETAMAAVDRNVSFNTLLQEEPRITQVLSTEELRRALDIGQQCGRAAAITETICRQAEKQLKPAAEPPTVSCPLDDGQGRCAFSREGC